MIEEPEVPDPDERLPLERDLQSWLAGNLTVFGEQLALVGKEYVVPFGRIDLLARDVNGRFVVIELKIGSASRDAIGQLQSYMGALQAAEPKCFVRGILVAKSLDAGGIAALSVARNISFLTYEMSFTLTPSLSSPSSDEGWREKEQSRDRERGIKKVWVPPSFKR